MGWADAPAVAGGENWKKAPQVEGGENVVMQVNGGRIVQSQSGNLSFVSPSYATSDPAIVKKIMDGVSAGEMSKASIREGIIAENPLATRLTKFVEGTPFVGTYVDELVGGFGLNPEATTGVRALSSAMQEQRPGQSMALGLGGGLLGGMGMAVAAPAKIAAAVAPGTGRLMTQIGRGLLTGAGLGAGVAPLAAGVAPFLIYDFTVTSGSGMRCNSAIASFLSIDPVITAAAISPCLRLYSAMARIVPTMIWLPSGVLISLGRLSLNS